MKYHRGPGDSSFPIRPTWKIRVKPRALSKISPFPPPDIPISLVVPRRTNELLVRALTTYWKLQNVLLALTLDLRSFNPSKTIEREFSMYFRGNTGRRKTDYTRKKCVIMRKSLYSDLRLRLVLWAVHEISKFSYYTLRPEVLILNTLLNLVLHAILGIGSEAQRTTYIHVSYRCRRCART